jgi:hypothetical protein
MHFSSGPIDSKKLYFCSTDRHVTGKLLAALQKFGSTLNDYMHLFLPPIVRLFDSQEVPMGIRKGALVTSLIEIFTCGNFIG